MSDDLIQDHVFVDITLNEMLNDVEIGNDCVIIICSDNCAAQYKSAAHFYTCQQLANKYNTKVIRC